MKFYVDSARIFSENVEYTSVTLPLQTGYSALLHTMLISF
jgi:hypothetical protein